jgi:hypothetical protein
MNRLAYVSMGFYLGTTTATKRAHLVVSMGLFDPTTFPGGITGVYGLSIMSGLNTSILGG